MRDELPCNLSLLLQHQTLVGSCKTVLLKHLHCPYLSVEGCRCKCVRKSGLKSDTTRDKKLTALKWCLWGDVAVW